MRPNPAFGQHIFHGPGLKQRPPPAHIRAKMVAYSSEVVYPRFFWVSHYGGCPQSLSCTADSCARARIGKPTLGSPRPLLHEFYKTTNCGQKGCTNCAPPTAPVARCSPRLMQALRPPSRTPPSGQPLGTGTRQGAPPHPPGPRTASLQRIRCASRRTKRRRRPRCRLAPTAIAAIATPAGPGIHNPPLFVGGPRGRSERAELSLHGIGQGRSFTARGILRSTFMPQRRRRPRGRLARTAVPAVAPPSGPGMHTPPLFVWGLQGRTKRAEFSLHGVDQG